jgi:hypothetical protein
MGSLFLLIIVALLCRPLTLILLPLTIEALLETTTKFRSNQLLKSGLLSELNNLHHLGEVAFTAEYN